MLSSETNKESSVSSEWQVAIIGYYLALGGRAGSRQATAGSVIDRLTLVPLVLIPLAMGGVFPRFLIAVLIVDVSLATASRVIDVKAIVEAISAAVERYRNLAASLSSNTPGLNIGAGREVIRSVAGRIPVSLGRFGTVTPFRQQPRHFMGNRRFH